VPGGGERVGPDAPLGDRATASVYIAISDMTPSPVAAGTTPKFSTMRPASMQARRNSSSIDSAVHCSALPWTMKNPPRSPPWGSRSVTSIPSIRPSDCNRPNIPTNSLKTSTARSSRPRTGCPNPMNSARSAITAPSCSLTIRTSQTGRGDASPAAYAASGSVSSPRIGQSSKRR
jgi:hypothetical protein